jgi:hypothetical protein
MSNLRLNANLTMPTVVPAVMPYKSELLEHGKRATLSNLNSENLRFCLMFSEDWL